MNAERARRLTMRLRAAREGEPRPAAPLQVEARPGGTGEGAADPAMVAELTERLAALESLLVERLGAPGTVGGPAVGPGTRLHRSAPAEPPEGKHDLIEPLAPVREAALREATGPLAEDAQRLFARLGVPHFGYREIGRAERRRTAARQADLHLRECALPAVQGEDAAQEHAVATPPTAVSPREPGTGERVETTPGRRRIPPTVAIVSLTPESGRTTLTANLAGILAQEGHRPLAVDLDPGNALGRYFGVGPAGRFGLSSSGPVLAPFRASHRGASCVPYGEAGPERQLHLEAAAARDPLWLEARLEELAGEGADLVLLDTAARTSHLWRQAVALADRVLVVVTPEPSPLETVLATEALLEEVLRSASRPPASYVFNRFDSRRPEDRQALAMLRGKLGHRMLPYVVQDDVAVPRAAARERLLLQCSAGSQVVADLNALAEWVLAAPAGSDDQHAEASRGRARG